MSESTFGGRGSVSCLWAPLVNSKQRATLWGTRRVGGLLGVAGRLSGTVSPFRAEQGTSFETPSRARASTCQEVGTTPGFDPWFGKIPWRRKWQPTPVFLPGESRGKSMVGYYPRGSCFQRQFHVRESKIGTRECRRNSRKTTWFPPLGKMRPLPAWASLAQRSPASSVLAREGVGCGSVGDVPGAWLASAPLSPSLWT